MLLTPELLCKGSVHVGHPLSKQARRSPRVSRHVTRGTDGTTESVSERVIFLGSIYTHRIYSLIQLIQNSLNFIIISQI